MHNKIKKETYKEPEIQIILFGEESDIIRTSGGDPNVAYGCPPVTKGFIYENSGS